MPTHEQPIYVVGCFPEKGAKTVWSSWPAPLLGKVRWPLLMVDVGVAENNDKVLRGQSCLCILLWVP